MLNQPVLQKPNHSINLLLNTLSAPSRIVEIGKGSLVSLNDGAVNDCFLMHHGTALVRRSDTNLVISTIDAPLVFGFNTYLGIGDQIHLEAVTEVSFEVVPSTQFYYAIRQHHLWERLLDVTMYLSSILFRKNAILTIRDSAVIINHQLRVLMAEHDAIRLHTCVHDYIQQRTHLSRSGIMKHLSVLREKGCIEMKNGYLLAVYTLPNINNK